VTSCEVAVVGAGIVGVATARELAQRGVDVCLLDAGDVSGGTTGLGEGNVLCSDCEPGPELELTLHGLGLYDEIEELLGDEARIRRKGALIVHPDEETWALEEERVEQLRAAGVEARLVDEAELRAMEPELAGEVRGASWFPRDLQCDPHAITRALARALPSVRTGARVEAIEVEGGRVTGLRTDGGGLAADAVVIAAGAWSAELAESAGLHLPVEPRWGQLVQLRAPDPDTLFIRHKVVDGAYMGSVASGDASLQVTTVLETTWEGHVIVGSSRERRGFDDSVDPSVSERMVARAGRLVPRLGELAYDTAWSGLRPWLPDNLPAIGRSSAADGLWIATGHEGAGIALGPVTGRVLAQAIRGEPTLVDLAPFDPDRFGPQR
jgi:glycine/D-amino acid oxidase-like deaminating enzyme